MNKGTLYIVATPIGNLEDITLRAIRILGEADLIACEDTRTSGVLLKHYDIHTPTLSFHSHSGNMKTEKILEYLRAGKTVALISDAGTPGISDPGFVLVRGALDEAIPVVPIPGVSAVVTALSASGMDTHHFLYLWFLPIKKWRQTLLKSLVWKTQTVVIYESVHRIVKTLHEFAEYFWADTPAVVARELTKKFETFHRGTFQELWEFFSQNSGQVKGEFVIIF